MKFLLDTQLALWMYFEQKRLSAQARSVMENMQNQLVFSTASLWEIAHQARPWEEGISV